MALLGQESKVISRETKTTTLEAIQRLKKGLSTEDINNATRRYHQVIKTLNSIDFQINMENKEFYQEIFKQCLLEVNTFNPKSF